MPTRKKATKRRTTGKTTRRKTTAKRRTTKKRTTRKAGSSTVSALKRKLNAARKKIAKIKSAAR